MALPLGTMGVRSLPNESAVLSVLKQSIPEAGLYFFPGMETGHKPSKEEQKQWELRYAAGPTGVLIYHPVGEKPMSPGQLVRELISDILAAWFVAFILSLSVVSLGRGAMIGAGLGLFAWLSISVSYWNWYGYPGSYVMAEGIDQVVGWLIGGVVVAAILKPRTPKA